MKYTSIEHAQSIYCVGIGGIGVSALAQLLVHDGKRVSGEDRSSSAVTEMLTDKGIDVAIGQRGSQLELADCIIYSSAVPVSHPARLFAREQNITELHYFEALGAYMQQFEVAIAVSGTHGKTTTTALIANMLVDAGLNPTAVVGSIVKEFGDTNARAGGVDKKYIVVEACEHEAHMLQLHPTIIVVNNIEADHLDYYRDVQHITDTFQEFVQKLENVQHVSREGEIGPALIVNADDSRARALAFSGKRISFGIESVADIQALYVGINSGKQIFTVDNSEYILRIPGQFNVSNSLAAVAVGRYFGIDHAIIARSLQRFQGTWRRFQKVGVFQNAIVISDYAHHPTAVQATIRAAKEFFPDKRIVVAFQPHQRARTKELFADFLHAFIEAGVVIIQEIYDVAGREDAAYAHISSRDIVDNLTPVDGQVRLFTPSQKETTSFLEDFVNEHDVVLVLGAGDMYRLAESLAENTAS